WSTGRRRPSWSASRSWWRSVSTRYSAAGGPEMSVNPSTNTPVAATRRVPLVEMRDINVHFGGVRAVSGVSVDVYPGEVIGLVGGNGAGKSTLMRTLSGARPPDSGEIRVNGQPVTITNPRDAKALGIETIYQTL